MQFFSVVLGGTFDRLHTGHQSILTKAFFSGEHVTIGLTTDEFVNNIKYKILHIKNKDKKSKRENPIFPYTIRKRNLELWLHHQGWGGRYTIIPLSDSYGPTIIRKRKAILTGVVCHLPSDFDAIVVSSETRENAEKINALRQKQKLEPLHIIEIPMIPAEDLKRVSSTRVRSGEIDRNGRLILPDNLRPELRIPIGDIIPENRLTEVFRKDKGRVIVTVGDVTTKKIIDRGMRPNLAVIDFQVKRKPYLWDRSSYRTLVTRATVQEIQSGPGYISSRAMQAIRKWGRTLQGDTLQAVPAGRQGGSTVLLIDGEEDLLVLPVLLEAPRGSIVYYGQPRARSAESRRVGERTRARFAESGRVEAGQPAVAMSDSELPAGVVRVEVTDEKKQIAKRLLKAFIAG